jgi:hypothetical protein
MNGSDQSKIAQHKPTPKIKKDAPHANQRSLCPFEIEPVNQKRRHIHYLKRTHIQHHLEGVRNYYVHAYKNQKDPSGLHRYWTTKISVLSTFSLPHIRHHWCCFA